MDGRPVNGASVVLDTPVQAALEDLDAAFDYGLYGLQAYAVVFSLWPTMSRAYEQLLAIVEAWSGESSHTRWPAGMFADQCAILADRDPPEDRGMAHKPRSGIRRYVCAMCERAWLPSSGATLAACLTPLWLAHHAPAAEQLRTVLRRRLCQQPLRMALHSRAWLPV